MTSLTESSWSRRRVLAAGAAALSIVLARRARGWAAEPTPSPAPVKLTPEQEKQLEAAQFVYIQSMRKDGTLSRPAEIWFAFMDGAVWVGSSPDSWRAKRIRWKRPQARIAIGSPGGPAIMATGAFVKDPAMEKRFCDRLAVKYPAKFPSWEKSFREGLASGTRVLIRYTPVR